ncbi:hypothetical protein C922_05674 [Plasmodium inui San Antonio 1]|uniref:Uncharacterized protein n=1 Tax=Plasmodium inui San Antonio 1 TaxID=1237626 RepID=W6ZSQ0_9APIC|nr:hypothetical protein C922_05674 [Plasmodium inui San Antonio 1]EUD63947.1 hypothetical protein C922_05674 [Plasmodium inui San Antonio 1]
MRALRSAESKKSTPTLRSAFPEGGGEYPNQDDLKEISLTSKAKCPGGIMERRPNAYEAQSNKTAATTRRLKQSEDERIHPLLRSIKRQQLAMEEIQKKSFPEDDTKASYLWGTSYLPTNTSINSARSPSLTTYSLNTQDQD